MAVPGLLGIEKLMSTFCLWSNTIPSHKREKAGRGNRTFIRCIEILKCWNTSLEVPSAPEIDLIYCQQIKPTVQCGQIWLILFRSVNNPSIVLNNLIIFDDSSPCLTIINLTICTVLIDWISNYFISHTFSQGTNEMAWHIWCLI